VASRRGRSVPRWLAGPHAKALADRNALLSVGPSHPDDRLRRRRCECGALDCIAEAEVTWEEDDAVDHSGENPWIVAPGHQLLGAREAVVVSGNERFSVVRAVEEWP
jgi:hypothetical protein